jgi:hypothetical protein
MEAEDKPRRDFFPIIVEVLAGIVIAMLVSHWLGFY